MDYFVFICYPDLITSTAFIFLAEAHGQRSLAGSSPWGCRVGHDVGTRQ